MNLTRGWLYQGRPRCLEPAWLSFVAISALSIPALTPAAHAVWDGSPSRAAQAAEADVLPGSNLAATPDLLLSGSNAAKADALAAFSKAIVAEDNADSDTALQDYQKALALDPGYTELAVKVAYELARRGDPTAGIEVLKDSIKASPKAPLAYLYLSQLYGKYLSKQDVALKYAQQALDLDPTNFAAYVATYEIYAALKQPAKAAGILDRAAKQSSTDPQFWLQLGDFYRKTLGDTPSAEDLKKVAAIYQKVLALAGDDLVVTSKVADFFAQNDRPKEAIPLYLKVIQRSPANPPEGDTTLPDAQLNLARCFAATGKSGEAIDTLKELIKSDPLRYESYDLLCDLYENANKSEEALAVCQQMELLRPSDYNNYIRTAALLMKERKFDEAVKTLMDAREKFAGEAKVSYTLGLALSEAKRYKEALDIFEQTVQEASQGETQLLDAPFYFAYGAAAEQCGEVEKAAGLLKKSIELDPSSAAEAYNYLGYMWVDRGLNLEEGAQLIRKALQMEPDNAAYVDSLGWYYFKKGDLKQALITLKKAASMIKPEDATVDEHLGDAYAANKDMTRALDYWQRSAALDKDNKEIAAKIANARQKLESNGTSQ